MYRNGTMLSVPENIPYEITQTQILKLGAENVSEEHIDKLNDFAHSSYIQIFDNKEYATKKWKRCSVEKYDIKRKTDASALNYEIELNIPEPNILF
jgi:histone H3/H4